MTVVTSATLGQLDARVTLPRYDRRQVSTGIVHIGVGNFHRSHQAMYLDTLMNEGAALDWGICGIGLQPSNRRIRDVLAAQDGLYTLVLRHGDGTWDARVIGSITGFLFAPDDPEAAIEKIAAPATRIVSLTITEGGYNLDDVTGEFRASDESVLADLRPGAVPRTVFGIVTEALARRRERGIPAFTILSCDNIPGNGHVSQRAFTAFARLRDPGLAGWITRHVRFPNSMVDRITPVTTDADRAELSRRFGLDDQWPVLCEPFTQWVLEDDFTGGRPPLEDAGVQIVPDVEPYELMKLRLLNASHQALCYPGHLVGYRLVHEVTADPLFAGFLLDYMTQEAIPTLRPVPGVDLGQYAHQLIERFSNPEVGDTLARLATDASDRIPKFLLPVIRQQLAAGRPFTRSAAVVASWARYAEGTDENGAPHEINDDLAPQLRAAAGRQRAHPAAFLEGNRAIFGDLATDPRFTAVYSPILTALLDHGVRATFTDLDHYATPSVAGRGPAGLERKSP
jgi:mannitol 2-dehydrogenase